MSGSKPHETINALGANALIERSLVHVPGGEGLKSVAIVDALRPDRADALNAFVASVRLASKLRARGLQRIASAQKSDHGALVLLEVLPEITLTDLLEILTDAQRPHPPLEHAAGIVISLAQALSALHEAGRYHGGLTLQNVTLSWRGEARVCDLIHSWAGVEPPTSALRAPEGNASAAADVYALGQICARLIGGISRAPHGLRRVLEEATAAHPIGRTATAKAFAVELRAAVDYFSTPAEIAPWLRRQCAQRFNQWKVIMQAAKQGRLLDEADRLASLLPRLSELRGASGLLAPEAGAVAHGALSPSPRSRPTEAAPSAASLEPPSDQGAGISERATVIDPMPPMPEMALPPSEAALLADLRPPAPAPVDEDDLETRDEAGGFARLRPPPPAEEGVEDSLLQTQDEASAGVGWRATPAPTPAPYDLGEDDPAASIGSRPTLVKRLDDSAPSQPSSPAPRLEPSAPEMPRLSAPSEASEPQVKRAPSAELRPPEEEPIIPRVEEAGPALVKRSAPRRAPRPERAARAWTGEPPPDGFEPDLWGESDDDEDYWPVDEADAIERVVAVESSGKASGDPNAVLVVEVVQLVHGRVVGTWLLHAGERYPRKGRALVKVRGRGARLTPAEGDDGVYHHLGHAERLGATPTHLELGDRAEINRGEERLIIRVDHGAREAGKATGERVPWLVYVACLGLAVVSQLSVGLAGVMGLESFGVEMTVDSEAPPERFAVLKEDLPLPELKKKLEKPKPKKKKKKRKIRRKKKKEAPKKLEAPKTPQPKVSTSVRNRVRRRMAARSKGRSTADQALAALTTPNLGEGETLQDVVTNFDAVGKKGSGGGAMNVVSALGALPGGDVTVNVGRHKGGSEIGTLGGAEVGGKGVGKVGKGHKRARRGTRGKVKSVRAFTKVKGAGCQIKKAEVRAAIERRIGQVQGCYERALGRGNVGSGKVTVEWVISSSGKAKKVRISVSTLSNNDVKQCILKVVRGTKFPKPGAGECKIKYPFLFSQVQ